MLYTNLLHTEYADDTEREEQRAHASHDSATLVGCSQPLSHTRLHAQCCCTCAWLSAHVRGVADAGAHAAGGEGTCSGGGGGGGGATEAGSGGGIGAVGTAAHHNEHTAALVARLGVQSAVDRE